VLLPASGLQTGPLLGKHELVVLHEALHDDQPLLELVALELVAGEPLAGPPEPRHGLQVLIPDRRQKGLHSAAS